MPASRAASGDATKVQAGITQRSPVRTPWAISAAANPRVALAQVTTTPASSPTKRVAAVSRSWKRCTSGP